MTLFVSCSRTTRGREWQSAIYLKKVVAVFLCNSSASIMGVVLETKEKKKVDVYYVDTPMPCVVEENLEGYFHDHDDFALAEILQDQETVYQSLQRNAQNDVAGASSPHDDRFNHGHGQSREEGNSSVSSSVVSQLAMDEALARELQELENHLVGTSIGENTGADNDANTTHPPRAIVEGTSSNMPNQVVRQDGINPDNMTYEELQSLGETIGTACQGLSDELISFLPYSTYKTGLFSKREKKEDCTICCMSYKNRDKLIKLPCQHQYHKTCVTRWLKIKKVCPICNEEVFGS